MVSVVWRNSMNGPPQCDNARACPRGKVVWIGSIWLTLPSGECDTRTWRSNGKITRQDAQSVLQALLASLIGEHGNHTAVDSGFTLKSR